MKIRMKRLCIFKSSTSAHMEAWCGSLPLHSTADLYRTDIDVLRFSQVGFRGADEELLRGSGSDLAEGWDVAQ
jgi:hypothetical protein